LLVKVGFLLSWLHRIFVLRENHWHGGKALNDLPTLVRVRVGRRLVLDWRDKAGGRCNEGAGGASVMGGVLARRSIHLNPEVIRL